MRRRTLVKFAIAFLLLLGAAPMIRSMAKQFAAETYDAALVADDTGDEVKAFKLFKDACEQGSELACTAWREQVETDRRHK